MALVAATLVWRCTPDPSVRFLCELDGGCLQAGFICDPTGHCSPLSDTPDAGDAGEQPEPDGGEDGGDDGGAPDAGADAGEDPNDPYVNFQEVPRPCGAPLCFENPLTSEDLLGVWGASPSDVWVVGTGGTALHWNGERWRLATHPAGKTALRGVWGQGLDRYLVGDQATLLRWSRDAGVFTQVPSELFTEDLYAVSGKDGFVVASGAQNALVLIEDGTAVLVKTEPGGNAEVSSAWVYGDRAAWLGGAGGALYHLTPENFPVPERQELDPAVDLLALHGDPAGASAFAAGTDSTLYRNDDPTQAVWTDAGSGPTGTAHTAIWSEKGRALLATDLPGLIRVDDGNNRLDYQHPARQALRAVWGAPDGGGLFAVGDLGSVLRSDTGLAAPDFDFLPGGVRAQIRALAVSPDGRMFAAGERSALLERQGQQWHSRAARGTRTHRAVFVGADAVWTGDSEGITRHVEGAEPVEELQTNNEVEIVDIWGPGATPEYAVGFKVPDGFLFTYDADAHIWKPIGGPFGPLYSVHGTADGGEVWITGSPNLAYRRQPDGGFVSMVISETTRAWGDLWVLDAENVWAVETTGDVAYFDGGTWRIFPDVSSGFLRVCGHAADNVFAVDRTRLWNFDGTSWSVVAQVPLGHFDGMACADGGVFISGDGGTIARYPVAQ